MLFSSLIEAAQNSPFKKPFTTASCEPAPAMENNKLTKHHNIQAAAANPGGIKKKYFWKFIKI